MKFTIENEDIKLKFGMKFCRTLDEAYKVDYRGMQFGMGVNMAFMGLQQKNPVAIAEVIFAAASHEDVTKDQVDKAVDSFAEKEGGLNKLFTDLEKELGNSKTVMDTLGFFKKNAQV